MIGIFWKRFGTSTGDAQSGTEQELRNAWEAWRKNGRPDVMVYFSAQQASPATSTELEQWHRVVKFREKLPKEQLWWSYTDPVEFERLVRGHLEDVLLRRTVHKPPAAATRTGGTSVTKLWFGVRGLLVQKTGLSARALAEVGSLQGSILAAADEFGEISAGALAEKTRIWANRR